VDRDGRGALAAGLAALSMSDLARPSGAVAALLVACAMTSWLRRRLDGYTGDTLGGSEQLAEVSVLLVSTARWLA
jgi:adenosylcobinamide-GDP ribazoletransferase